MALVLGGIGINKSTKRLSASGAAFQPKIADQVKTRNVLLDYFMPKKKIYQGSTEVQVKFRYKKKGKLGENTHCNAFTFYDELTTQPSDTIKTGAEPWCQIQEPVSISHQEKIENKSKKEFDLFKDGMSETMDSVAENMNDILLGISGQSSLVPSSIFDIVSGSNAGTIAGLSKASNTWLYSQETTGIGDAATNLLDKLTHAYNLMTSNCPSSSDKPDLWFTDMDVFEVVQGILPAYVEYDSKEKADIGFPTWRYMGAKGRFDKDCPLDADNNHQILGLTGKYWEMAQDSTWNMMMTEFVNMIPNQAADIAQLFERFAVICNNPRTNWIGTGVTVS